MKTLLNSAYTINYFNECINENDFTCFSKTFHKNKKVKVGKNWEKIN
jgi:hypothetical protein